mmetsp:Transcript_26951/g.83424  ORF Transcript_26951/g.83424 Transcript_26951/m.83424 type:complete len:200 (+) Transcript_26951:437-1036(+)
MWNGGPFLRCASASSRSTGRSIVLRNSARWRRTSPPCRAKKPLTGDLRGASLPPLASIARTCLSAATYLSRSSGSMATIDARSYTTSVAARPYDAGSDMTWKASPASNVTSPSPLPPGAGAENTLIPWPLSAMTETSRPAKCSSRARASDASAMSTPTTWHPICFAQKPSAGVSPHSGTNTLHPRKSVAGVVSPILSAS